MVLTSEAKDKYIADEGKHCPYCGAPMNDFGQPFIDHATIGVDVVCYVCEKTWTKVFTLQAILEDGADENA